MRKLITLSALALTLAVGACAEREPTALSPIEFKKDTPPPVDAELVALGEAIFFDENLSIGANQSCASCHDPAWGWTGPSSDINAHGSVYEGSVPGRFGNRKPPSSAYATVSPMFHFDGNLFVGGNFWDGRATGEKLGNPAADQAQGPFLNPLEQALGSAADVVTLVCASDYASLFQSVWGSGICDPANVDQAYDAIALSIAAYEGSDKSNAFTSKYDLSLRGGGAKLTKEERQGLMLFNGKGKCAKCHTLGRGGDPAFFTDFTFDNLGIPLNPENPFYTQTDYNPQGTDWRDPGLGGFLQSRVDYEMMADGEMGKHKVPTLRNVDLRPGEADIKAYGHNGYFKSLWEIVHFYNTRDVKPVCAGAFTSAQAIAADCWPAPEIAENVNTAELGNLKLTYDDEMAIVAFLKTLSDGF